MNKVKRSKIKNAIREQRGNVAAVARVFGVSRQSMHTSIHRDAELSAIVEEARETMLDSAENILYDKVAAGDITALIFYLKTQGKRRGYVERTEHADVTQLVAAELARRGLTPAQAVAADPLMADLFAAVGLPVSEVAG